MYRSPATIFRAAAGSRPDREVPRRVNRVSVSRVRCPCRSYGLPVCLSSVSRVVTRVLSALTHSRGTRDSSSCKSFRPRSSRASFNMSDWNSSRSSTVNPLP